MDDYMFGEYVALCKYFPEETHYVEILNYSVGGPWEVLLAGGWWLTVMVGARIRSTTLARSTSSPPMSLRTSSTAG